MGQRDSRGALARNRLSSEEGITLIELLVTCTILLIILGGLTDLFVSALHSQGEQTSRAAAQQDARTSLDRIRRQIHSGCSASSSSSDRVNVTLPSSTGSCSSGTTTISWCATGAGVPYTLNLYSATSCGGTATPFIKTLTSNSVFAVTAGSTSTKLSTAVTLPQATISLDDVSSFASGTNLISIGPSSTSVTCTGKTTSGFTAPAGQLTGCTGGTGTYSVQTWVVLSGSELTTVNVTLAARSPNAPYRQYKLSDSIGLRNSRT